MSLTRRLSSTSGKNNEEFERVTGSVALLLPIPGVRSLRERVTGSVALLLPIPGVRSLRERVTGIEPALSAWEADVLPLNYTRDGALAIMPADHASAEAGCRAVRAAP